MKQNPEYLDNQSRHLHTTAKRRHSWVRVSLLIFTGFFALRFIAATLDVVIGLGWNFVANDIWASALFVGFAGFFWVFAALIEKFVMSYTRHTYGPDPGKQD